VKWRSMKTALTDGQPILVLCRKSGTRNFRATIATYQEDQWWSIALELRHRVPPDHQLLGWYPLHAPTENELPD